MASDVVQSWNSAGEFSAKFDRNYNLHVLEFSTFNFSSIFNAFARNLTDSVKR